MNTCFHSDIPAPESLPAIGTRGFYLMPAIIVDGQTLAREFRVRVEVIAHIGTFGIHLREIDNPRMEIETHFTCFIPA